MRQRASWNNDCGRGGRLLRKPRLWWGQSDERQWAFFDALRCSSGEKRREEEEEEDELKFARRILTLPPAVGVPKKFDALLCLVAA